MKLITLIFYILNIKQIKCISSETMKLVLEEYEKKYGMEGREFLKSDLYRITFACSLATCLMGPEPTPNPNLIKLRSGEIAFENGEEFSRAFREAYIRYKIKNFFRSFEKQLKELTNKLINSKLDIKTFEAEISELKETVFSLFLKQMHANNFLSKNIIYNFEYRIERVVFKYTSGFHISEPVDTQEKLEKYFNSENLKIIPITEDNEDDKISEGRTFDISFRHDKKNINSSEQLRDCERENPDPITIFYLLKFMSPRLGRKVSLYDLMHSQNPYIETDLKNNYPNFTFKSFEQRMTEFNARIQRIYEEVRNINLLSLWTC